MLELLDAGLPRPARGVFTTRAGGGSPLPWDGLNLGWQVADDPARVMAHRSQVAREVGLDPDRVAYARQVHGRGVAVVTEVPDSARAEGLAEVDALVTSTPGTGLVVLAADCLPVLLVDPVAGVVAAAHAGRVGLVAGVLQETLRVMATLGAEPPRITAVLGPAACGRCYEVPDAMAVDVGRAVPGSRSRTPRGTSSVDLVAGAGGLLRAGGVRDVRRTGGCTIEQPDRFFSFRRAGQTGRHGGLVWLAA
ncbi:MAG: peptidoglycan editing factor PgeF [Frankiales bacterium]|nr:peptidoglycan editing factor PgeF [Frankiales bacterium]